jgi:hypothetical protein
MLKALHNHIFASKLRQVFDGSQLVLVYQSLGDVDVGQVSSTLQAGVDKALPAAGVAAEVCRMRNSIAAQTGDPTMQQLFRASNLLVGFRVPPGATDDPSASGAGEQQAAAGSAPAPATARRSSSLPEVVGGLFASPAAAPHPQLPHATAKALIDAALKLPGQAPLVLMGAFYQRQPVRLRHLEQWRALDAGQVRAGPRSRVRAPGSPSPGGCSRACAVPVGRAVWQGCPRRCRPARAFGCSGDGRRLTPPPPGTRAHAPRCACCALWVQVYAQLLEGIEGPLEGVCEVDSVLEQLVSGLDDASGASVVDAVEWMAAAAPGGQQGAGGAGAGTAPL